MKELIETFQIHNRINTYLLDAIDENHLSDIAAISRGRTVGKQWAHMHNVRLIWLQVAAPELMEGLTKFTDEPIAGKVLLKESLLKSGKAIEQLFEKAAATNKIKGFKPHPAAFMGYVISHESHHRGQIILTLKQNGHMVDKKIQYGIWEWGVR